MQCIVFTMVVTKRNVVVVAKPISVVGAARVCLMSLNCSKTWGEDQNSAYHGAKQRAYLCKQIKNKKNNKKQDQRPTYQEKKDWKKKDSVSTLLKAGWSNYSSFLVWSGKLLCIFHCP